MPSYVQHNADGPVWVLACEGCKRDVRRPGDFAALVRRVKLRGWLAGSYGGRWVFICDMCALEAETGAHIGGWRWKS